MPVPLALPVIVTQLTLLVAVHEHAVPVVTDRLPLVAVDGTDTLVGDTPYTHCACTGRAWSANASKMSAQLRRRTISLPSESGEPRRPAHPAPRANRSQVALHEILT